MKTSLYLLALIMLLAAPAHAEVTYTLDEDYGNVPVTFVPNEGQFDDSIVFAAEGNNGGVFNDDTGLVYQLAETIHTLDPIDTNLGLDFKIYLRFKDADTNPEITYEDQVPWKNNYFIGNDSANWHTDVPNYKIVRFHEIYPGIDLVMEGNGRNIESTLVVKPHADPSVITFNEQGIYGVDEDGNLLGKTYHCVGDYCDPISYVEATPECVQYINGEEIVVDLKYHFTDVPDTGDDIVSFEIGEYDPEYELVIKPYPVYSPLMRVKSTTEVNDIAIDDEDYIYVAGAAEYIFPTTGNAVMDALFAMKLNEAGDELGYVTYYKSNTNTGSINDICVDTEQNLYLTGGTNNTFPTTQGAYQEYIETERGIGYVMKINQTGNIVFSTLIGGNDIDQITDISINKECAYITGWTISRDFPTTPGVINPEYILVPYLDTYKRNGFVTKFNNDGSNLEFSTYFDTAELKSIQINDSGKITIAGNDEYIFVGKLNAEASDTLFTIRFGGNFRDVMTGMDIDGEGNIYVAGTTESDDFYITDGSEYHGGRECFVAKVSKNGSLIWSTLFGGSGNDAAGDISVDKDGNSYITGYTHSSEYPVTSNGMSGYGSFITIVNPWGEELIYSSVLGNTQGTGLSLNKNNDVFVFGYGGNDLPTNSIISEGDDYLVKLDKSGETTITDGTFKPNIFHLYPPYPNPFNPSVTLSYNMPQSGQVKVKIYNLQGQVVDELVNEYQTAGYHDVTWNSEHLASGVYLYHIATEKNVQTGKLLRMK